MTYLVLLTCWAYFAAISESGNIRFNLSESPLLDAKYWFGSTTCKAWRISAATTWSSRLKTLSVVDLESCSFSSEFGAKNICWQCYEKLIAFACLTVFCYFSFSVPLWRVEIVSLQALQYDLNISLSWRDNHGLPVSHDFLGVLCFYHSF